MAIPDAGFRRYVSPGKSLVLAALLMGTFSLKAQVNVATYQYDNTRVGANLEEKTLTPSTISSSRFGRLFRQPVDGTIYGQPLYLAKVKIQGKHVHNVVYVATEHDSVYAFDADDNRGEDANPLWHVSFIDPDKGITSVPSRDYLRCPAIVPEVGITSTSVIDITTGTLYVESMTKESDGNTVSYVHHLHALDVKTGKERPGSPVKIEATVAGTGDGSDKVVFTPKNQRQRPGLLLLNGVVYTAWSQQCQGLDPYHGWLIGYDSKTLRQVSVFNNTPNGAEASFWNSGAAPAADNNGNIFLAAGNGSFDYNTGGGNLGQSYIRLSTQHGLKFEDYFAPFDIVHMNRHDIDLGSSGILLLPDDVGSASHPHLLVGAAKDGRIYLIDRDHMGGHHSDSDSQVVQSFTGAITQFVYLGKPAYFNGSVYFCGTGNSLKQFPISDGKLETSPHSQTTAQFEFPGCVPTISANGKADAILWLLESKGVLRAYDPSNLSNELYDSNQVATRDALGAYVKFSVPIVANGKVYAGTQDALVAYGLLPQAMASAPATNAAVPH